MGHVDRVGASFPCDFEGALVGLIPISSSP